MILDNIGWTMLDDIGCYWLDDTGWRMQLPTKGSQMILANSSKKEASSFVLGIEHMLILYPGGIFGTIPH